MKKLAINDIYSGFSEELMPQIEAESISLSLWSPPYFVGKNYEKEATYESWQKLLDDVIKLHHHVLKPGGFMVINIADILCFKDESIPKIQSENISMRRSKITKEMVLDAKAKHPDYNRNKLASLLGCSEQTIDRRLNGNNIRGGKYNAQTRVKLVGGDLEKYAYEAGLYLYDRRIWVKDPTWANSRWTSNSLRAVHEFEDLYVFWKPGSHTIDRSKIAEKEWKEWGARGIWNIRSVRSNDSHEAMFPLELAQRIIKLYSTAGDTILDPFMGSGTSAIAAINTDRNYIGIEKELQYVTLAKERVHQKTSQAVLFAD